MSETRPTIYPHADHVSQWFEDRHPGALMDLSQMALVLHTTEGRGWWDYEGGSEAPTFTLWHGHGVRQHFPVNRSARALVHRAGTTPTNTQDCVQIELVGTCDRATAERYGVIYWPEATDEQMAELAHLVLWLHQAWGLKLQAAPKWLPYPASAGNSSARFNSAEWLKFEGICGHQHVVGNDHGDPGNFPIARLIALVEALAGEHEATPTSAHTNAPVAKASTASASPVVATATHPFGHAILLAGIAGGQHGAVSGNVLIVQHALRAAYPESHNTTDGVWRQQDANLYARWQRERGATGAAANGVPGVGTLTQLFALPAVVKALGVRYLPR